MKGIIKFYNDMKGFGFIIGNETHELYFIHASSLQYNATPNAGDEVSFDPEEGDRGVKGVNVSIKNTHNNAETIYRDIENSVAENNNIDDNSKEAIEEDKLQNFDVEKNNLSIEEKPKIILNINDEILKHLAEYPEILYDLTPRKFEELIARILSDVGFDVYLTAETRDGGKDIYAHLRNEVTSFLMYVECKRWAPENRVGVNIVRELYGVQQMQKADKSMIVTTSFFTQPAIKERNLIKSQMELKDFNNLKEWLSKYKNE